MTVRAQLRKSVLHAVLPALLLAFLQSPAFPRTTEPDATSAPLTTRSTAMTTRTVTTSCQVVANPSYFYPGPTWDAAVGGAPTVRYMIMNPDSGPGAVADPAYVAAVQQARTAGVQVLGYVPTTWGRRPAADVQADLDRYAQWYGVVNAFLDEAGTGEAEVGYYGALATTVHAAGGLVALNFGTVPAERYLQFTDLAVTFEGVYRDYRLARFPAWMRSYAPSRFWHLVYSTPRSAMPNALKLARQAGAGNVYVSDDGGANPWDTLPAYWDRELREVEAGNGGAC